MRLTNNMVNWFTSGGFSYAMEPGREQDGSPADERWYYTVAAGSDYEREVLRPEIKDWLDLYLPNRYRVAEEGLSGPETTWLRPIYFRSRADATIFKMEWQGQTALRRDWEGEKAYA